MRCQACMNDFRRIDGRYVNYKFYCIPCSKTQPKYLLIEPKRVGNKIVIERPTYTRDQFIEYAFLILGNLHPRSYKIMDKYHSEGATWFDMARALEYFYVIRKNDVKKANNSIGILPYVYKEAYEWYTAREEMQQRKMQRDLDSMLANGEGYQVIKTLAPKRNRERKALKPLEF